MPFTKCFVLSILLTSLSGCITSPTRLDVNEFQLINEGRIYKKDVLYFVDCLSDGFNSSHYILTNAEVRQSQRADSYRVETYTGSQNILLMSADIFKNGYVALYESSSAALINTKGERKSFNTCFLKYKK